MDIERAETASCQREHAGVQRRSRRRGVIIHGAEASEATDQPHGLTRKGEPNAPARGRDAAEWTMDQAALGYFDIETLILKPVPMARKNAGRSATRLRGRLQKYPGSSGRRIGKKGRITDVANGRKYEIVQKWLLEVLMSLSFLVRSEVPGNTLRPLGIFVFFVLSFLAGSFCSLAGPCLCFSWLAGDVFVAWLAPVCVFPGWLVMCCWPLFVFSWLAGDVFFA